ncbi:LamG-like jellyroll fold domain-containing protein [Kitasatospora sp. NPDC093806]|uniref:LamG-like jellyroll fold domain-containing protein n=1 Tax=Kitasatospora sp. NPDC093806 TaxID=3155075 RepID=UPI00343196BB
MGEITRVPSRGTRPPVRRLALTAALAGLILGTAGPALAADRPAAPTAQAAPASPLKAASDRARKEHKPVTVEELTSETSQTVANADGGFTLTNHVQPVRVKRNGSWAGVDATLDRRGDGTLAPKATPSGLTLSGGGAGPLATLTDAKGRSLSLTFPLALPAPTVSGDSATYGDVLPGVDLKVIASDQGGLREVLVVRDAAAAANPALKSLKVAVATSKGLTVAADQDGAVTAKAADGTTAFAAPTPVMWDSSTTANRPAPAAAPKNAARGAARDDEAPAAAPVPSRSTEREPGTAAKLKKIAVTAEADALTLTPDSELLTGADTVWPLYIDPSVSPVTNGTSHYATVREGCPSLVAYDTPQDNGEGAGYQHWNDCQGLYRSFYQIDTSNLTGDMVVSKSEFHITETYGASFDCNHTAAVSLATVSELNSDASWGKQPWVTGDGWLGGTQYPKSSNISNHCGNHEAVFTVTGQMQKLVGHNSNWTVGIYGNETKSSSNNDFMRFNTNPYVVTVFDIAPNAPDMISVSPQPHNPDSNGCDGVNIGWVGNSGTTGEASNVTLNARLSTKMSGVNLQAMAHVWDNMGNDGSGNPATKSWPWTSWVSNWGTVYDNIGFTVEDGHQYGWNMVATDGTLNSPSSPYCYFNVDLTPPSIPSVADNAAFPPLGGDKAPTGHAGDTGVKVKVTANDPVPGGCSRGGCISSGIDRFEYSLDANIPSGGPSVAAVQAGGGTASADIPISVSSAQWGTHTLFVRAVDKAGNTQGTVGQYSFFAPFNPNAKVAAGDLNGDGVPDLAATTTDGNLLRIPGGGSTEQVETISTAAKSPDGTGWNNYLVAHRGTLTAALADDLFAFQKSTHQLYLYQNDANTAGGTTGHFTLTQNVVPIKNSGGCPAKGSDGTWNRVTQILAPGKLAQMADVPDLLTVDNKELWYYPGTYQAGCNLAAGVKIGTGDWSNTTLIAPGTVNGAPTLWARDNATGAVASYPLTFDGNGVPTTRITAPTRAPLVSGVLDGAGKNMCLDINGSDTANGTPAQMYNCNGTGAQTVTLGGDGTIHLLGKCLDVSRGGLGNGSAIQLWDCNNTGAQKWVLGPFAGSLLNPQSGRCLADPAASNTPKTQLILWDCLTDHAEQIWAATTAGKALPQAQPLLALGLGDRLSPTVASPGDVDGDGNPDLYATSPSGDITRLPGTQVPAAKAADRWKLADGTDSRRDNALTLGGGAAFGADPVRGTALNLSGGNGYAVSATGSVDTTKSYTVSAWVKPGDLATNGVYVSQGGTNGVGLQLYYSSWAHAFAFGRNVDDAAADNFSAVYGPTTGGLSPQLNTWSHLTGVYDAGTKQFQLYVNGVPAGTAAYSGTNWKAAGPVQLGRRVMPGGGFAQYATGSVADVVIVPSALSAAAATALATDTAQFGDPVALGNVHQPTDRWKLTDANDAVRPANKLTVSGSAGFVSDAKRGTVLGLTGAADGLATTAGPMVDTGKSYSVSAWAYLTKTDDYATVAAQSGSSVSAFYLQYSKAFNAWTFISPSSDVASPASYPAAFASTPPVLNTWTHLVATYDAASHTMSLYVNGKPAATAVNPAPWAGGGPLTIGSAKNGNYFPGRISDVQTWTSALSPAAVAALDTDEPVLTQLV